MKNFIQFILILVLPLLLSVQPCKADILPGVKGDGVHDDTKGIQDILDSGIATIYLPQPAACYLVSKTLKIHSGQTLIVDQNAVIRLADHAGVHLISNSNHKDGNERITIVGGIWDGNNLTQTMAYHEDPSSKDFPYDPNRYIGVLMQFDNVKQLHISNVTFKDPETYAFLGGNLYQFTIENIIFDYNLMRGNMDGIHIVGNSHHGRITNLKGTTSDDLIALNAEDYPLFELASGPITDIQVDGIWAEDAHRAVRMLSCGSPIKRIKISNIFGTYLNEAIILSNHNVHPNCTSEFEDISISGLFSSNSAENSKNPHIKVFAPAKVSHLSITDYHRTESVSATDNILIEEGVVIEYLSIINATLKNKTNERITFLNNKGTIKNLHFMNIFLESEIAKQVLLIKDEGTIHQLNKINISTSNSFD